MRFVFPKVASVSYMNTHGGLTLSERHSQLNSKMTKRLFHLNFIPPTTASFAGCGESVFFPVTVGNATNQLTETSTANTIPQRFSMAPSPSTIPFTLSIRCLNMNAFLI